MSAPVLSVVIPTFRRPADLRRTLAALVAERPGVPWEVVVSDDGSPPDAAAAIDQIVAAAGPQGGQGGPVVSLVRQRNGGPAAARNHGARAAQAPLLLFLDDDCAPVPGLLRYHLEAHQQQAPVAVMGHVSWDPALRVTPFMELVVRGAQFNYGAIADPDRVPFTCFYTANCSLRREHLAGAGWFDASLPPYMEDTEFAYRLVGSGVHIVYRREAVVHHTHSVELATYLERQRRAGKAAVQVAERHPELVDVLGVSDVADVALREQFYSALLRYAFVLGVEEALSGREREGAFTGGELRSQFESWIASRAVEQASEMAAWRQRAEALAREVAARDARLAEVVQQKDEMIAGLEQELSRLHRLPPVRLLRAVRSLLGPRRPPPR